MGTQAESKPQFSSPGPDDPAQLDGDTPPEAQEGGPGKMPKGTQLAPRKMENLVPPAQGQPVTDLAATSAAEHARTMVQLKYMIAQGRPRIMARVQQKLEEACSRPEFAEDATYTLPKRAADQDDITGPSIRFSEELVRSLGNILPEAVVTFDDEWRRKVQVSVTDLEDNVSYSEEVVIEKTVERRSKVDREVVGERMNKNNQKVYRVRATDEELREKQGNLVARVQRNLVVKKVAPSWLVDLGLAKARETQAATEQKDLPKALERMRDAFLALGVMQVELEQWLTHPIAQTTVHEYRQLRGIAAALRDNSVTWEQVKAIPLAQHAAQAQAQAQTKAPPKEVKAEVIDMSQKPVPRRPMPGDPYDTRPAGGLPTVEAAEAERKRLATPIPNEELKDLISLVDQRDCSGLTDQGANEALRALLARVRGVEDNDKLFTASIQRAEVPILRALIADLPLGGQAEVREGLPGPGD